MKNKILVLGVGNSILSDEGVGVHLARRLQQETFPPNVEIQDGGTKGLELLDYMEDVAKLIIVDCLRAGSEPGSIFRFEPDNIEVIPKKYQFSFHDLGIYDFLRMATILETLPPTIIFGMEPQVIEWGEELSPPVAAKMDKFQEFVTKEIHESLLALEV